MSKLYKHRRPSSAAVACLLYLLLANIGCSIISRTFEHIPINMLREDIIKVFQICGYILLYSIAAVAAGFVGRLAGLITEKCILQKLLKDELKPYMECVEISQAIFVLICATGFLIVAVGLLFLHLIGLLPPEYDEVAFQVAVAFFGLIIFVCMCLVITTAGALPLWTRLWYRKRQTNIKCNDEEAGLLKDTQSSYGTDSCRSDPTRSEHETPLSDKSSNRVHVQRVDAKSSLPEPEPAWIKLVNLSSIRDLDVARIRQQKPARRTIYPRGRSVG